MNDAHAFRAVCVPTCYVVVVDATGKGNKATLREALLKPFVSHSQPLPQQNLPRTDVIGPRANGFLEVKRIHEPARAFPSI